MQHPSPKGTIEETKQNTDYCVVDVIPVNLADIYQDLRETCCSAFLQNAGKYLQD
jgi:hypothetical protein